MDKYQKLYKGSETINPIGIGLGAMQVLSEEEIEQLIKKALDNGINFFDLCGGGSKVYAPFGKAIKDCRDKVYIELHFGAVYNDDGEYGWSRDLDVIKNTFEWEMKALNTDYVDFGFLHCIDTFEDLDEVINNGIFDYVKSLKEKGIVKHMGFSSHTPKVCEKLLDMGCFDLFLFSINPAYDYELGDEYGIGTTLERSNLLKRCVKEGVGISVMKPYFGGLLLDEKSSPFKVKLSIYQCLKYCLDRPGVIVVCPGITSMKELDELLMYNSLNESDLDYSVISNATITKANGICVYCNHCMPCPVGIDIALVNKYYDLAMAGDEMAKNHYYKLAKNANDCIGCKHCDNRCPFKVKQSIKMKEIKDYFNN